MLVCVSDQMREGLEILYYFIRVHGSVRDSLLAFLEWWLKMHELELYCILVCFSV